MLGKKAFNERDWKVIGEYVYDAEGGRHQAFYAPLRDTYVLGELIRPHERVQVEESLKYSPAEAQKLWNRAGMAETNQWRHRAEYGEWHPTRTCRRWGLLLGNSFPFEQPEQPAAILPHAPEHVGTSRMSRTMLLLVGHVQISFRPNLAACMRVLMRWLCGLRGVQVAAPASGVGSEVISIIETDKPLL